MKKIGRMPNKSGRMPNKSSRIPKKNGRIPIRAILVIIILIAFICGLAIGVSAIFSGEDSDSDSDVGYVNVTKNITKYENGSDVIETEDGSYVTYAEFEDNITEGENVTAFDSSQSGNLY